MPGINRGGSRHDLLSWGLFDRPSGEIVAAQERATGPAPGISFSGPAPAPRPWGSRGNVQNWTNWQHTVPCMPLIQSPGAKLGVWLARNRILAASSSVVAVILGDRQTALATRLARGGDGIEAQAKDGGTG